jgi:hypothetical protein
MHDERAEATSDADLPDAHVLPGLVTMPYVDSGREASTYFGHGEADRSTACEIRLLGQIRHARTAQAP